MSTARSLATLRRERRLPVRARLGLLVVSSLVAGIAGFEMFEIREPLLGALALGALVVSLWLAWFIGRRTDEVHAQLAASEAQMRLISENLPAMIAYFDRDCRVRYANRRYVDFYAGAGVDIQGWHLRQLLGEPYWATIEDQIAKVLAGELAAYEREVVRADGEPRNVALDIVPHRAASGEILGAYTLAFDITERKRAEKKLRKRDAHLRLLTEHIPAAVAYADRDQVVQAANQRYMELYCGAGVEVIGRHLRDVVGKKAWPEVAKRNERVFAGESLVYERTHERPDGERREIEVHLEPDRPAGGEVRGYYAFVLDMTERKRAEETRARLAAVVETSSDAIISRTPDGTIQSWNEGARHIFGYSAKEAVGRDISIIAPPEHRHESRQNTRLLQVGKPVPSFETVRIAKDGRRVDVQISVSAVRDDAGNVTSIASIFRDVTERKNAEEDVRRIRLAMDNSVDIIIISDRSTMRHVDVNQAACRLLGYTREELLRLGPQDVLPVSRSDLEKTYDDLIANPAQRSGMRSYYRCKDGSQLPFESTRHVLRTGDSWFIVAISRDIRERLSAEQNLRESEARFRNLTELSSDFYWEQDEQFRFVERIGPVHEKQGHYPLNQAIGKTRWEIPSLNMTEADWAMHRADLEAHREFRDLVIERPSDSGFPRFISTSGQPIFDRDGRFRGYRGVGTDITERMTTENVLRLLSTGMAHLSGEAYFNEVANRMAEYLQAEIGFVSRLQRPANERMCTLGLCIDGQVMPPVEYDLAGAPCEPVIGKQPVVLPDHVQQQFPACQMLVDLGVSGYAAVPLFDTHGNPIGDVGVMSRAPLRQSAERIEALLRLFAVRTAAEIERLGAEARFKDLFEFSADACVIVNQAGIITAMNRGARSLLGYSPEELIGLPVDLLVPETLRKEHAGMRRNFHAAAASRPMGAGRTDLYARRKDGTTFPVDIDLHPLQTDDGVVVVATVHDMTAYRRDEERRRALELQLRQSQKMEAIGTLAGGIAHDFNNIIGAILGNAELAREDVGAGHPALESIAEINKAGRRARDLVQQILAFSRKQALSRSVIALGPVVEEAVKLLQATLPAGVRLTVDRVAGLPNVSADPTQIHQVLVNLCTNAWHAMEGRPGHIGIHLEEITVDAAQAREHVDLRPGKCVRLSVRDTGKGMDAATKERIFEPFFTTKAIDEGTGLGLSVVHGIMQGHEGAITVDSTPGVGTTFRLYFPAVDAPAAAHPAAAAVPALPRGRQQHVLYLDDDEALVSLVSRMLERQGYRVSGYTLAEQALDAVRADPDGFDLVVSDYNMPRMSGLDVARELSRIRPDLPIAVTSGFITDELREKAPRSGVRHLISKPDTADELCEVVRRLTNPAD